MANELIVFPDTEGLVIDALNAVLTTPVVGRVPTNRPASFVRVARSGGVQHTIVTDAAYLTVESWAKTDTAAVALAQLVRAHLNALPGQTLDGHVVYRVNEVSGPGNLPDPLSAQSRYTQQFEIHVRGSAAS